MSRPYDTPLALYINGERLGAAGRSAHTVINPATGGCLSELPLATTADLDNALEAAARGFRVWRATAPDERSGVLATGARR